MNTEQQVERNYEAFKEKLPELLKKHEGRFSLWHNGEMIDIYDTRNDCMKIGEEKYGDGNFSYQEITDQPADLGFLSICQ